MNGSILLKQLCTVGAILLCLGVSGCRDDVKNIYKGDEGKEEPEKVPNDFGYETFRSVEVTIHYDVPKGYRVHFEAYTKNPLTLDSYKNYVKEENLNPFLEGWTNEKGEFSYTTDIASMVDEIYVYSSDEGVPMLMKTSIVNNKATLLSNNESVLNFISKGLVRANNDYYQNWSKQNCTYKYLGQWDRNGKPNYLLTDGKYSYEPTPAFNNIVNATHPDNSEMAIFYNCPSLTIKEKANVFISFISHNNSERNNVLAYYTFNNSQPEQEYINKNLVVAFPNTNAEGLQEGDVVQLKYNDNGKLIDEFPAGSQIGFVLLVDAFNNNSINGYTNVMYSYNDKNRWDIGDAQTASKPALISYTADGQIVLAFEDMPWNDQAQRKALPDFHDDVFVINANPIKSIPVPPSGVDPELPKYDVIIRESGILAFEDNWPDKGDYDLNDVVVSYYRESYRMTPSFSTVALDERYTFMNNGADFVNGFGYIMDPDISPSDDIDKLEITSTATCEGQGLDNDLSSATVMLFNNAKTLSPGVTFDVRTVFKAPKPLYKGFNPFIVVTKNGKGWLDNERIEVHLPKYAPTPKGDISGFGQGNDASNIGENLYYVRGGTYPFAIRLIDPDTRSNPLPDFVIPAETKPVDVTYPKFENWVLTEGKEDSDWYLFPKE